MGQPFQTTRRVEFHQTDAAGIMHFAQFYLWMEQAEHELLRSVGLSVVHDAVGHSVSWPRVACSCQYFRPVRFEDVVDVAVSVERMTTKSVTYITAFQLRGHDIARGEMTAVCCEVRSGHLTAIPIPDTYRRLLWQFQAHGEANPSSSADPDPT
ncbi:MAG: thioesterase family protein [Pirellulales bacterium]